MPSSEKRTLKALHLASNVGDLNKLADLGYPADKNANPATYVKSADKVFLKAESHYLDGEEEDAYVFFMRYFNIICLIKKTNKYTQQKKFYDDMLGRAKIKKSIERAEALQRSLEKRYEKLSAEKARAEEEARRKEEEDKKKSETKSKNDTDSDSGFDSDLDSLLNGSGINSSADVFQKLKVSHSSILTPKSSVNSNGTLIIDRETKPIVTDRGNVHVPFVSAPDLYNLLNDENGSKVLVIDCRPHSMFQENRINLPSCINIPSELLDIGVSAGSIERRLREDTRKIWNKRGEREFVVLMDESTKVADITPENRIQRLKDVIFKFDSNSTLKNEPLILDGGFHSWLWHYPSVAVKPELPKVIPQPKLLNRVDLSNFDYPELPEEKTSPPEPQLPTEPESLPNKDIPQSCILPFAGIENYNGSLVKPSGGYNMTEVPPANSLGLLHSTAPIPGTQPVMSSLGVVPPRNTKPLNEPGPVQTFQHPTTVPPQSHSQNGVPFPRPSDVRPQAPSNPPSALPSAPLLKPSKPQFGELGPHYGVGSVAQPIAPYPSGSQVLGFLPNTAPQQQHPHQPVSQPGGQPVPAPPVISPSEPSSSQQPLSPVGMPSSSSPSPKPTLPVIPTPHPAMSQSATPFHNSISGHEGSRHSLPSSSPTVSSVPATQTVNAKPNFPPASLAPIVSPAFASPAAVQPASSSAAPRLSSQQLGPSQRHDNSAPSLPVQMSHQSSQEAPPGHQSQAPSVSQIPPGGEPSMAPVLQPPKASPVAASGVEPRSSQHGAQTLPNNSQIPPDQHVSASAQNSQSLRGNSAKTPDRALSPPVDQKYPETSQESVSNKQTSYVTTPGLPPGWEKVYNEGKPYYKDHNTHTTHWAVPTATASSKVYTAQANVSNKDQQPQMKRQSSVERPKLQRSLSSPNLAKLVDQGPSGPKRPVIDRFSKPGPEQAVPARPIINRSAKPLTANQLDSFNPSHGGTGPALTGLRNLGNTCYMSSVVQCLSSVAPLAAFFISGAFREDINRSNRDGTRGELAEKFSVLIKVLHSGQFKCVSPNDFKRTVGKFKSQFSGYDQQDSQELLAFLMDGLQEDLNKIKEKPYLRAPPDDLDPVAAANIAWENHKRRNASIMVELFDGLFMSTVKCMVCGKESRTFDAFSNLTLPLPSHKNRCTLQDCLNLFTEPEKMTGDDKWFCPKCQQRREVSKTIQIWRLPAILVVHLKRFQYEGMWRQKLQTNVSFPTSQVDMSNHVVGPRSQSRYNLFAVSNHYGTMHGGHYTAFAKSVYDKKWYKFDDQCVTEMSPRDVVTSAGYLLFYTSLEFKPPRHSFKA